MKKGTKKSSPIPDAERREILKKLARASVTVPTAVVLLSGAKNPLLASQ